MSTCGSQTNTIKQRKTELQFVLVEHEVQVDEQGHQFSCMSEIYVDDGEVLPDDYNAEKPNNAFFQYRMDPSIRDRHRTAFGSSQESQIVMGISKEWNELSDAEKLPYERKAAHAAVEHKRRLQNRNRSAFGPNVQSRAGTRKPRRREAKSRYARDWKTIFAEPPSCSTSAEPYFNFQPPVQAFEDYPPVPFHQQTQAIGTSYSGDCKTWVMPLELEHMTVECTQGLVDYSDWSILYGNSMVQAQAQALHFPTYIPF